MIQYNIITGKLYTGLDTPYDKEGNKIDVYTSVYWTANNEKEYNNKESIINDFRHENELFKMFVWCDASGYDYWVVKQEEPNYVAIDVYLKKQPEQYTQEELQTISKAIIDADDYFIDKLREQVRYNITKVNSVLNHADITKDFKVTLDIDNIVLK